MQGVMQGVMQGGRGGKGDLTLLSLSLRVLRCDEFGTLQIYERELVAD